MLLVISTAVTFVVCAVRDAVATHRRLARLRRHAVVQHIDVRGFSQDNHTPYGGDASFLTGPTDRTRTVWEKDRAHTRRLTREQHLDLISRTFHGSL
ncbi:hypothetical protein [Streptomyces sp. UG1]|uniref:hypothetical protein n=1 Tax=Streptomyces sp. UG1 TaxID=3417652 RepID=UPI003CEB49D0